MWRPSFVAVEAQVWRAESAVLSTSPDPYAAADAPSSTAPVQPVLLPPAVESAWAAAALSAEAEEAAAASNEEAEEAAATSLVQRPGAFKRFAPPEDALDTALDSELSLTELMTPGTAPELSLNELMTSTIMSLPMRSPRAQHGAAYEAALATALAAAAAHPAFAWSSGAVPGGIESAGGAGSGYDCSGGGCSGAQHGAQHGGGGCSGSTEQEPNYDEAQHGAYLHGTAQHGATLHEPNYDDAQHGAPLQEPNYGAEAGFDALGGRWGGGGGAVGMPNTALSMPETAFDGAGDCGGLREIANEPPSASAGRRDWLRRKVRRVVWEAVEPSDCH